MLPIDCIWTIVQFCRLKERARCARLSKRYFPIDGREWKSYAKSYQLTTYNRQALKLLFKRNYSEQLYISKHLNCLWSNHFDRPLVVWSPWTIEKCCHITPSYMIFRFRLQQFVNFVRRLVTTHGLKTTHLSTFDFDECVRTKLNFLRTKRIEMNILKNRQYKKRFCSNYLKIHKRLLKARALLDFRVSGEYLHLKIRKLDLIE